MAGRTIFMAVGMMCLIVGNAPANPTCDISQSKRNLILSALCGQTGDEHKYQEYGTGCVRRSLERRLEDSVIPIDVYKLCGDESFAAELEARIVRANEFIEQLAVCVSEEVDVSKIFEERAAYMALKFHGKSCTPAIRERINAEKPKFQKMIEWSNNPNLFSDTYRKLGIRVDTEGNVTER